MTVNSEKNSLQLTAARSGSGCGECEDEEAGVSNGGVVVAVGDAAVSGGAVASKNWKVPDGGYGWVIVVSAMIVSLIVDGLSYTFGLFLGEFERAFDQPKSTIALASSLQVGIYLFVGPIVSALTNRFGCRPVIICGSFLAGLAFVFSSWSNGVTMLIVTYGIMGGIGFGLMYLPAIVAVSIYFEERRAVATGIAVCGSGIGTFILAPLTDYLLYQYNWRWTLLLLGGLVFNGMVFGALVRPLELKREDGDPDVAKDEHTREVSKANGQQKAHVDKGEGVFNPARGRDARDYVSPGEARAKEEIPLLSIMDNEDILTIKISEPPRTAQSDEFKGSEFSSSPAMEFSSGSQLSKDKPQGSNTKITSLLTTPEKSTRRRTMSTSDRDSVTRSPARAHVPVGLSLISLSDANLNQIREDVALPLSRKDIHLSGPLAFPDSDARRTSVQSRGLYIQSMQSIASLAAVVDSVEMVEVERRGLWSCLPKSARETMEEMLDLSILKDRSYWCVLLGNFFCMLGFYVPFVYVPDRAQELGIPEDQAAFLISIIGITNTIGRVMTGVLINFLNLDCTAVTSGALLLAGIVTIICPFCHTYPSLAAISAIFGICVAAYISLCSVLLCELLGVDRLTNAFGYVILFRGVACIMGPPIAGAIIDNTGLFDPSFYVAGGMIVLGAISHAVLLTPILRRRKR